MAQQLSPADRTAIVRTAARLGIAPADLTAVMMYETKGTLNPDIRGGTGGNYKGLIQFGPSERRTYGYQPGMTIGQQVEGPVYNYLVDRGVRPGMDLAHIYSVVNAGSLKNGRPRWNASDGHGTIRSHVARIRNQFTNIAQRLVTDPPPIPRPRPVYPPTSTAFAQTDKPQDIIGEIQGLNTAKTSGLVSPPSSPPQVTGLPDPLADRGTGLERAIDNRAASILTTRNPALPGALGSGPGPSALMPQVAGGNLNIHTLGMGRIESNLHGVGPDSSRAMPYTAGMGVSPASSEPSDQMAGSAGIMPYGLTPPSDPMSAPLPGLHRSGIGMASLPGATFGYRGAPPAQDAYNVLPTNPPPAPPAPSVLDMGGSTPAEASIPTPAVMSLPRPSLTMPVGLPQSMPRYIEDDLFTGPPTATSIYPTESKVLPAGDIYAPTPPGPVQTAVQPQQQRRGIFGGGGILGAFTGGRGLFGGVFQPRTSTGRFANGSQTRFQTGATATPFVGVGGSAYGSRPYNYATVTTPDWSNPHP